MFCRITWTLGKSQNNTKNNVFMAYPPVPWLGDSIAFQLKTLHPMAETAPLKGAKLDSPGFKSWKEAFDGIVSEDQKAKIKQSLCGSMF